MANSFSIIKAFFIKNLFERLSKFNNIELYAFLFLKITKHENYPIHWRSCLLYKH